MPKKHIIAYPRDISIVNVDAVVIRHRCSPGALRAFVGLRRSGTMFLYVSCVNVLIIFRGRGGVLVSF